MRAKNLPLNVISLRAGDIGVVVQTDGQLRSISATDQVVNPDPDLHGAILGATIRCMGDEAFRAACLSDYRLAMMPAAGST